MQRRQKLLREEGVAVGLLVDELRQRRDPIRRAAQHVRHQRGQVAPLYGSSAELAHRCPGGADGPTTTAKAWSAATSSER